MKPTINLYFDFEFSSLSPDANPISLGIVSGDIVNPDKQADDWLHSGNPNMPFANELLGLTSKTFYSEFTDFDINRCDEWVKENVVGKLKYNELDQFLPEYGTNDMSGKGSTSLIKLWLYRYLEQFSDYQITFVADCGTFDWYHLLQLLAKWDEVRTNETYVNPGDGLVRDRFRMAGLPKLPSNISPIPQDLNDLIAIKKGISVREAFDWDRQELAYSFYSNTIWKGNEKEETSKMFLSKHNALWDAKVIKAIYEKLM